MKKSVPILLLFLAAAIAACGRLASPIVLPDTDEIVSIHVTDGDTSIAHSDRAWIEDVISKISDSAPTRIESVNDAPNADNYLMIEIRLEKGASRLYAYKNKAGYYVEQPYEGIYEINGETYEMIKDGEQAKG